MWLKGAYYKLKQTNKQNQRFCPPQKNNKPTKPVFNLYHSEVEGQIFNHRYCSTQPRKLLGAVSQENISEYHNSIICLFTYTFPLSLAGIPEILVFCILVCMVVRKEGWECFRNTNWQHSCCMFCVIHCKQCMLSLKLKNSQAQLLVSLQPIVGTDGGTLGISFLFCPK